MAALGSLGQQFETVLGLARQFIRFPSEKRPELERELAHFLQALTAAESNLEETLTLESEENSGEIQEQYDDLQSIIQSTEELEELLTNPSSSRLESILDELREPLNRLGGSSFIQTIAASTKKPEAELRLEFQVLRTLCGEVAEVPIHSQHWKHHIEEMKDKYQKAVRKLKSAIAKEQCPDKERKLLEMRQGYRTVLKGLKRIESFDSTLNPADLNNGQLELLEGYSRVTATSLHGN